MSARRAVREDLVGIKFETNNGLCTVLRYETYKEVYVTFDNTGYSTITTLQRLKEGMIRDPFARTCSGIGFLGVGEYKAGSSGKHSQYYLKWSNMLSRCYAEYGRKVNPSYNESYVIDDWHNMQNYAKWYTEHPYRNDAWEIDKDILTKGNKVYSPETCIFVPKYINTMFTKCDRWRGDLPIGVHQVGKTECYKMICSDSIDGKITISGFTSVQAAFDAYKETKEKVIKKTANVYRSGLEPRAYEALMNYEVEITD